MKKHSFIRNLFKKMTIGKLLGISSIVLFFLGLFFAVNKIHGAGTLRYIQVDVGAGAEGPYVGAPFIIKDEYGNNYWEYQSDEYGEIQFCIDSDNGRCELGYEDLGKIFYISEDCDSFHDDTYVCDKSAVKVSVEADGVGDPYARYFYLDEYGNQGEEVYFSAGDDQYIFNNKIKDCIEIKSKVKALGLEEGQFEFDLRNTYGVIEQTTTNDESGDIKFCVDTDGTYLITQNFNNAPDGYIIDSAIIKVSVKDDGYGNKNIQYHKDYYLGNGDNELCFEGEDVNYLNWGYQYQAPSSNYNYYSYNNNYVSFDSWSDWDWNNYVVNDGNGLGYLSDYYDFQDWNGYAFYNKKAPVCIEIETSVDSNKQIQSGQFEFGLFYGGYSLLSTVRNNGSGLITFSKLDNGGYGGWFHEYDRCDIDGGENTQGDYSRLCYDIDAIFGGQGEYPSYNYESQYQIEQINTSTGECKNYDCDTGAVELDVSLTCDITYYCNADLTYSDTGFFNAIYTATFDANGADSIGENMITGVTITMPSITRHGYLALGWSTDSGATVAEYAVGESVTLTGDVTLYAITKPLTATFIPGIDFNKIIKSLATGATVTNYPDLDRLIQQVIRTGTVPTGVTTGLLSTNNSEVPVVGWFDDGILYYYTEADILYLNQSSNSMFYGIQSVIYIDTSGWNTSKVTNMSYMFYGCSSLTKLDVSNWDTSNVINMHAIFLGCSSLTELDVSNWDTSSVTDMSVMFSNCSSLTNLDLNNWDTSSVTSMQGMFERCTGLTGLHVNNWDTSKVTNMSFMFISCSSLTGLDVSDWDTSKVTNMYSMFRECSNLMNLGASNWDTSSVTDMSVMFYQCSNLTNLDVSKRNTSSVTTLSNMFYQCRSLTGLDVSKWNTSSVTIMSNMFYQCSSLTNLDVSNWNTSNVTIMSNMFYNCSNLTELDISDWDTSKVTNMNQMFLGCSSLTELDVSGWDTSSVTNMGYMFFNCNKLNTIYASTGFITSGVTNSASMFSTPKLIGGHGTKYDRSYTDKTRAVIDSESQSGYLTYDIAVSYRTRSGAELTRQVINVGDTTVAPSITGYNVMGYYTNSGLTTPFDFSQELRTYTEVYVDRDGCETGYKLENEFCKKILTATFLPGQTANLTFKSLAKGTTVNLNFQSNDYSITKIVRTGSIPAGVTTGLLSTADSETPIIGWYTNGILYYYSEADILYLNEDSSFMFYNLSYLTGLDVSELNTSKVTNMQSLFAGSYYLSGLDVSNWDTSNVTNMSYMFDSNNSNELDVSKWDTSKVTDMAGMFFECRSLKSLDVSKWDTSKVTNMSHMFRFCDSLTGLDVSSWNTSSVINMGAAFQYCSSLTELDVSKWDTSNVTDMHGMFLSSSYLTKLDVSKWDTSNVTDMHGMFKFGCPTEFDVSKWNTSKVVNMMEMFRGCSNLTGLDVRGWNTSSVTNMGQMFYNCSNLNTIYASTGFITSGVTYSTDMFQNTPKLVGGHGTKSPSLGVTKSGAVLDSESQSGYLTYDIAVSYRTRSGVELARQVINVGDTTVAPSIIRTGYAVSGWYTDTGLTTLFDFSQSLRKYTELYVMWKCDTGYMLSGDGVTCIPLTYEVRHFIKNAGVLSYTLSGTEIYTGIAGERVNLSGFSRVYPSCIVYSRGSLTGDTNGPGVVVSGANIAGDGTTVLNLYYDRNTYTVDLSRDFGIDMVEGAGTYECGQEVQIRAYPIDGYHFDMWEGNVD